MMAIGRFVAVAVLGAILATAANAQAPPPVDPEIEMEVSLLDAGRRAIPENRFVAGEGILVKVRLCHVAALDYVERAQGRGQDGGELGERPVPIAIGAQDAPWTERVRFTPSALLPARRPAADGRSPARDLADTAVEYWHVDSETLPLGASQIGVEFAYDSPATGEVVVLADTLEVTLVSPDTASPDELARVGMREGQALLEEERYEEALGIAAEAISRDPGDPIDLASLYQILGVAHEGMGEVELAIEAYERALQITEEAHPGRSRLPELLRQRIQRLRG
jgi:tetratricopeptide (TPR) repeat protein